MKASTALAALPGSFDLAGSRTPYLQSYITETRVMMHAPDGSITATDVYRLFLLCTPSAIADGGRTSTPAGDSPFSGAAPRSSASRPWRGGATSSPPCPSKGRPTGGHWHFPHEPFETLKDSEGKTPPPGNAYHVYNAFIDFHSFFISHVTAPR